MSRVFVETYQCYRKNPFHTSWSPEPDFIEADQLVAVLNSAAEDGPDRYYVLRLNSTGEQKFPSQGN